MPQDIGSIQIGIGVDVGKLQSELNTVTQAVKNTERKLASEKLEIPVRIREPSPAHLRSITAKIKAELNKAQQLKFELTPTIIAAPAIVDKFIADLQGKVGNKEISVPIVADIEAATIRSDIKKAIGVIDIGLTWHWEGDEPPSGATGGGGPRPTGGGGGGGGGAPAAGPTPGPTPATTTTPTPAERRAADAARKQLAATTAGTAAAGKATDATKKQTAATEKAATKAAATAPAAPAVPTEPLNVSYHASENAAKRAAAKSRREVPDVPFTVAREGGDKGMYVVQRPRPAEPIKATPVEATVAGAGSVYAGLRPKPLPEAERPTHTPDSNWMTRRSADPTIERAMARMQNRDPEGITDLLALGGSVKGGELSFRKRSLLGKAPEEQQAAIKEAFGKYQAVGGMTPDADNLTGPRSPSGINATARKLAAPIGLDPEQEQLNTFLRELQTGARGPGAGRSLASRQKARAYAGSEAVQAFKAKVAGLGGGDEGFLTAVLGPETDLIPNIQPGPGGPVLHPSGYVPGHEGDPSKALYPTLRDAMSFLEGGEPDTAQVIGRHHLKSMFAEDPKLAASLLSVKKMRETSAKRRGTPEDPLGIREFGEEITPDPTLEALHAAVQSIFPEARRQQQTREDTREKEYRKEITGTAPPPKARVAAPRKSMRGVPGEITDPEERRALIRATMAQPKSEPAKATVAAPTAAPRPYGPGLSLINDPFGRLFGEGTEGFGFGPIASKMRRRAGGGVMRATGLLGRLAARGITPQGLPPGFDITKVGEQGEELVVQGPNGESEVIPHHQAPQWLQRAQQGKGLGKDLTGRADGGTFPKIQILGGGSGPFSRRMNVGSSAAGATGAATSFAGVQRVAVVNWPAGLTSAAQGAPATAAAGAAFSTQQMNSLGQVLRAAVQQAFAGGGGGGGGGGRGRGGAGAGAGAGGGGGGSSVSTSVPLTPLERAQIAAEQASLVTQERLRTRQAGAETAARVRELPTRGTPTSLGEISAIGFGGLRGVIERRRLAEEATTRATSALGLYTTANKELAEAEAKERNESDPQKKAGYTQEIRERGEAVKFLRENYEAAATKAEDLSAAVVGSSDKLRVFGANTAGVIAGTLLYSSALGAAQAGMSAIAEVAGPAIERMTGFQNVSAKTTSALADQIRESGGASKATYALTAATTGLSAANAAMLAPQIRTRAEIEAGNKAYAEQIDLLHTSESIGGQAGGAQAGLFRTTGGVFGTDIGGTASTSELLVKELRGLPSAERRAAGPQAGRRLLETGAGMPALPNLLERPASSLGQAPGTIEVDPTFAKQLEEGAKRLQFFNDQAQKGGEEQLKLRYATGASAEAMQAQADAGASIAALDPRLKDFAKVLSEQALVLEGATKPEDFVKFLQAQNVAGQRPSAELLIQGATERTIPNQLAAFAQEEQDITRPTLGAQQALEAIAAPPLPFGAGIVPPEGAKGIGKFPAVDPNATQSFNEYKAVATSALDAVAAKAKEGEAALAQLGVPQGLITEMSTLGKAAANIELGIADKQAAFDAAQYNRQLFVLNRNLADALALAGRRTGSEGRLGQLQRENFELSKRQQELQMRSQALSLAMTQKQINFQKALAGFQAPGETAEERAARIKEAEAEARYAQKQLDIQKQLFGLGKRQFNVGVRLFDAQAERQVQDLKFALQELQQARRLQLDTRAAEQALAAVRKRQQQVNSEIGIAIEKATKIAAARIGMALEIANKSGEAFAKILTQTAKAWNTFLKQGTEAVNGLVNPTAPTPRTGREAEKKSSITGGNAAGFLGNVSGATSMIVGEAGTETVAVLRNPRLKSAAPTSGGGGGGGAMIVIDVHDNKISGDDEADVIVRKISKAVEQSMNRKGALLNLRTV